ncbi:MAG: hypothetical protein WCA82_13725 [Jiangellales bacterium]
MSSPRGAADGVRHLARDVQRFGLLSAASVVERYVDLVDRTMSGAPQAGAPATGVSDRPSGPSMDRDTSVLVESATGVAEAYLGLLDAAARLAEPFTPTTGLVLDPVQPGGGSQASLWVHNPGDEPTEGLTVTMSALVSADGASLDGTAATCTPSRLDSIAGRGSARLDVRVDVPHDQRPGEYHGLVLVSLAAGEPISIRLQVVGP